MTDETEKKTRTREPTAIGIQIWSTTTNMWDDVLNALVNNSDGGMKAFDSTTEAKTYMKSYGKSCRFRVITIRGPYTLTVEQTTKSTIS